MATSLSVDEIARRLSATLVEDPRSEWVETLSRAFEGEPEKLPDIFDSAHRALIGGQRRRPRFTALVSMLVYPLETLAGEENAGALSDPALPERVRRQASEIVRDRRVPVRQAAVLLAQIGHARFRPGPELEQAAVERLSGQLAELGVIAPGLQGAQEPEAFIDYLVARDDAGVAELSTELVGGMFAFPAAVRIAAARTVLDANRPIGRAAALAWLTDRDPEVREAVADAVHDRARAGRLDPATVRRLETLGPWAPEAEAEAIQSAAASARTAGVTPEAPGSGTIRSAHVTGIDGSGLALVILEVRRRNTWAIAGLTVVEGQGIRAAWQKPVSQRGDVDDLLAKAGSRDDLYTVDEPVIQAFLAQRLSEGRRNGYMPSFPLLDIAPIAGLSDLAPAGVAGPVRHADLDGSLDAASKGERAQADALRASASWPDSLRAIASWAVPLTQSGDHVAELMSADPDPAVDALGEAYRTPWADRLTWLAQFVRAQGASADWPPYHLVAGALYSGRRMSEIPLARRLILEPVTRALERLEATDDEDPAG